MQYVTFLVVMASVVMASVVMAEKYNGLLDLDKEWDVFRTRHGKKYNLKEDLFR